MPRSHSNRFLSRTQNGFSLVSILIGLIALTLIIGGLFYYFYFNSGQKLTIEPMLASVEKGEFVSQVLDQGEIQSSENIEIRCSVQARNGAVNVLALVPEGTSVKAGDFLVRLDATSLKKNLNNKKLRLLPPKPESSRPTQR